MTTRRQATLYLPLPWAADIERLRSTCNPAQHALIRAHVTLCREDEVHDWDELANRLAALGPVAISLAFGAPVRAGDHVYLPATGSTAPFDQLRASLLDCPTNAVRKQEPHITLIHPRNGACSDATFASLVSQSTSFAVTFRTVALIAQADGGPWRELVST